jgi:hypothetical protein
MQVPSGRTLEEKLSALTSAIRGTSGVSPRATSAYPLVVCGHHSRPYAVPAAASATASGGTASGTSSSMLAHSSSHGMLSSMLGSESMHAHSTAAARIEHQCTVILGTTGAAVSAAFPGSSLIVVKSAAAGAAAAGSGKLATLSIATQLLYLSKYSFCWRCNYSTPLQLLLAAGFL